MKRCWPLVFLLGLLLFPKAAFADITWNNVYQGFDVTDDEYFVSVPKESTGSFGFSGGKFINPQGKYFDVVWVHTNKVLGSDISMDVIFGDGFTVNIPLFSTANQIPGAYFRDHPSKGITLKFKSDGRTNYKAYINAYSLQDYDGPGPSTAPTTAPTPKPTAAPTPKPTVAPTVAPTVKPSTAPSSAPTASPTSPTATNNPNPTDPGTTDPGNGEECTAACQNIIDQLECPQWDEYMGKWAEMIQSVIPPPPDWDMVADKIGAATINHLANYMGDVPAPPTREEIENETSASLPGLDTSVETNDLVPKVPSDYNSGKIVFDLNKDAPTIDVKDESQPFIISDPLNNVPHDDPGVKVLPGEDRNSTGGFKQPDKVDTGEPEPTPGKIIFELPRESPPVPNATPGAPPVPSSQPGTPPIPGSETGQPPTPGTVDTEIPIPKGGE